ncbi:hypothetical protein V9T40_011292 [Parthenolecanium corni]|uniref:Uncharacterized protein n=1 Tax=Parthenolecanium corni TaxID=536013 RepID=A0AAN9T6R1_9HEMI
MTAARSRRATAARTSTSRSKNVTPPSGQKISRPPSPRRNLARRCRRYQSLSRVCVCGSFSLSSYFSSTALNVYNVIPLPVRPSARLTDRLSDLFCGCGAVGRSGPRGELDCWKKIYDAHMNWK